MVKNFRSTFLKYDKCKSEWAYSWLDPLEYKAMRYAHFFAGLLS